MIPGPDDGLPQADEGDHHCVCGGTIDATGCNMCEPRLEHTAPHTPFAAARRLGDADLYIRGVGVVAPCTHDLADITDAGELADIIRGGIMAGRDPVTLTMELPTTTGPTPRRSAWNALEVAHQRTILDDLAQILADVRHKSWMSLAEARDKILAAVLD